MRKGLSKIVVTGGAGFIGSAFVRLAVKENYMPVIVDNLTYAGDLARLNEVKGKCTFYKVDICDKKKIAQILAKEKPESIVHFAAESHVDRSIVDSSPFIETNIRGTQTLLDCARSTGISRFLHMSTDEVYGEIDRGEFTEDSQIKPNSPYAASKAGADLLVRSYIRTFNFPAIIARPSNNYGLWQYPEKLIPLSILKIIKNEKIPVYADGKNVREWLYVDDCAAGILEMLKKGKPGEVYNLGSNQEKQNIEVVRLLLKILKKNEEMIEFVKDRPGHDIRYRLNSQKLYREFDWKPKTNFEQGIESTVRWFLKNKSWALSKWKNISALYK